MERESDPSAALRDDNKVGLGGLPGGATQEGLDANEEDVEVEGLGEVVVGAGLDAFEDIFGAGARGEHEDGGEALKVAQGAGDSEAVGAGQHAVEDDGGDRIGRVEEIGEGGVAVGFVVGAVALGCEVEEQALGEVLFVFDEGDEWGRVAHTVDSTALAGARRDWRGGG